jgi:ubiquinone/menaquinone biosynthesis C-methylase UbiE
LHTAASSLEEQEKGTIMDATHQTYDEQAALWNGRAGRAWVETQDLLDQMFKPLEDLLVAAVSAGSGGRVLDVGCGTGSTTLAAAWRLGAKGHCIGIDISEPMIAAARARAEREGASASFIQADAQIHAFEPASFDMIISRLGVMFFDDSVRAFANLRRSLKDDGRLQFIAWRCAAENPFMTTAERAAASLLPNLPARRPDAPGQFAFADQERVRSLLEQSGWAEIDIRAVDIACSLPEKDLVRYFTRLGPVGLILHEADDQTRALVIETVRAAFGAHVRGAEVCFTAACWMVSARSRSASVAWKNSANG